MYCHGHCLTKDTLFIGSFYLKLRNNPNLEYNIKIFFFFFFCLLPGEQFHKWLLAKISNFTIFWVLWHGLHSYICLLWLQISYWLSFSLRVLYICSFDTFCFGLRTILPPGRTKAGRALILSDSDFYFLTSALLLLGVWVLLGYLVRVLIPISLKLKTKDRLIF